MRRFLISAALGIAGLLCVQGDAEAARVKIRGGRRVVVVQQRRAAVVIQRGVMVKVRGLR